MTGTQLSFKDFAKAQQQDAPKRAKFYEKAFKEREKKNAYSFGLDMSESMFSLLWEYYEKKDKQCWEVAKEIAGELIGRGCEPKGSRS